MNIAAASCFSASIHIDLFAFGLRFVRAQEIERRLLQVMQREQSIIDAIQREKRERETQLIVSDFNARFTEADPEAMTSAVHSDRTKRPEVTILPRNRLPMSLYPSIHAASLRPQKIRRVIYELFVNIVHEEIYFVFYC